MKNSAKYCPEINSRWNNYNTYRLILWAWMMNEIAVVSAPVEISHTGFYMHSFLYITVTIFIGIPLVYSEICIAQYTNCDVVSAWNFCPILRGVGFATFYLIILKIAYLMVLMSWYMEYTFVATFDPPPWFSCEECDDPKCMVKRVNVSLFQHCIEAQNLFNEDCGMKTASSCFFEKQISYNNTKLTKCIHIWKIILFSLVFVFMLFVMLIKKKKIIKFIVRILAAYVIGVLVILFCVALSSSGTWYATKIGIQWEDLDFKYCIYILTQSVHACGTGCGIIGFLSRDISFRSPATMTAVTTPLFSAFITIIFALIIFSGIKSVSYYHGEEQNILELGESIFFNSFASIAEIMSYFNGSPLWAFIWFLTVFICLFVNILILCLFLFESLKSNLNIARKYKNICCIGMLSLLCVISCPFYCSDLTVVLADVTEIIQLTTSFFFSAAIYWIYGYQKHNVDIIFMIGVKASYFWKIAWITNPIWISFLVYMRWTRLLVREHNNSYFVRTLFINLDELLVYVCVGVYFFIIVIGMLIQVRFFYKHDKILNVFSPLPNWGPRDDILFRSRQMFVPEIMTREFLYRQVRIHGYSQRINVTQKKLSPNLKVNNESSLEKVEWSTLTSN